MPYSVRVSCVQATGSRGNTCQSAFFNGTRLFFCARSENVLGIVPKRCYLSRIYCAMECRGLLANVHVEDCSQTCDEAPVVPEHLLPRRRPVVPVENRVLVVPLPACGMDWKCCDGTRRVPTRSFAEAAALARALEALASRTSRSALAPKGTHELVPW